ncbi:hypothetical protein JCM12298_20290 [Desulfothermus naphthae]
MLIQLYLYEITKSVETVLPDPELAKKVIEAIEKGLYSIRREGKRAEGCH